jgi:hypothetical protein
MSPAASRSGPEVPGVVALDGLAERLAAGTDGLRVGATTTAEEVDAVLGLRRAHVTTHGWDDGDGATEDRDDHDDHAIQLAAWDGRVLVGTLRVVLPRRGRRLPVEDHFDLHVEPRGRVVEIGRLLIAPERRGDPAHQAWGALFAHAWLALRRRGFTVMAGAATDGFVARYRALGLPFEVLGPARVHRGETRRPVRLDPARAHHPGWYGGS